MPTTDHPILDLLNANGPMTCAAIAIELGRVKSSVNSSMQSYVQRRYVRALQPNVYPRTYSLTGDGLILLARDNPELEPTHV